MDCSHRCQRNSAHHVPFCRFASVLAELDDTSVPDLVRTLTDAHRSHMFDIVMQFRAIFYDGDAADSAPPAAADTADPARSSGKLADAAATAVSPVLASWAQHRAQLYVERLDTLLATCAPPLRPAPLHCTPLRRVACDGR